MPTGYVGGMLHAPGLRCSGTHPFIPSLLCLLICPSPFSRPGHELVQTLVVRMIHTGGCASQYCEYLVPNVFTSTPVVMSLFVTFDGDSLKVYDGATLTTFSLNGTVSLGTGAWLDPGLQVCRERCGVMWCDVM